VKAGDIKRFLEEAITTDKRDSLDPQAFSINDPYLLKIIDAFRKQAPEDHLNNLIDGFISTELLTVQRRVAVLRMTKDILVGLSKKDQAPKHKDYLKELLYAYYI
jgi:ribosomal protein L17